MAQTGLIDQIMNFHFGSDLEQYVERLIDFNLLVARYHEQHELEEVSQDIRKLRTGK